MSVRGWVGMAGLAAAMATPAIASAQAVRQDDSPVTPRMMALGGRAEALGSSTSGMFGNPAMITAARSYHGDAYILYDPTIMRTSAGSAIVDSTRSAVAAGSSYMYTTVDTPSESRRVHDTRMALALPLGSAFGLGVTGRYLDASNGPPVANAMSALQPHAWTGFTFDAGLYLRPVPQLTISATGYNLNNPQTTAAPLSMGAGVSFTPAPIFTLVADTLIDFASMGTARVRYSGGLELFVANHVPLRAGYAYDELRNGAQAVTGGVGYLDENFGVEVSVRQGIVPESQTTVMASLRFFYQPTQ